VSGLFGISALYHRGTWRPAWSAILQRADHMMIFFLIAGTATPGFLIATRGVYGLTCLFVMWALIIVACAIHLFWMSAPEKLVGTTFIGLGSLAGLAVPEVWLHAGAAPGILMLAGGLVYIAGALGYHWRRPDPYPAVFGYHEVFHACVCAAATCQYLSITLMTARLAG
jgi:hemolysin III